MLKIFLLFVLVTLFKFLKSMFKKLFSNKTKTNDDLTTLDEFSEGKKELDLFESSSQLVKATFAGGCFWCMEGPLESIKGVEGVILGYTGGDIENPSYEQVSISESSYRETALVFYDPKVTKYYDLVERYWKFIDPTDPDGQFADRGSKYHLGIFYHTNEQQETAKEYIREMEQSGKYSKPITVELLPATNFYLAKDNHQNYYKKQSKNYKEYYKGSGRKDYVESNNIK